MIKKNHSTVKQSQKDEQTVWRKVSTSWVDVAIVFLLIMSISLGVRIYMISQGQSAQVADATPEPTVEKIGSVEGSQQNQNQDPAALRASIDMESLPKEEQVLWVPDNDESEEIKSAHARIVEELAIKATELDVTNCSPDPLVIDFTNRETLLLSNQGDSDVLIRIGSEQKITIPAEDVYEFKTDFPFIPGIYGYGCDDSPKPVGIFFVQQS